MAAADASPTDPNAILRSRQFPVLLVLAAVVGVVTSAVAWGFLELIYQIQQGVYTHLPQELGFSGDAGMVVAAGLGRSRG